jgi:hypothetical protein
MAVRKELTIGGNIDISAEFLELFGSPPLLTSGEHKLYHTILELFAKKVQPRDVIERIYVRDAAYKQVEIHRYERVTTETILQARKELLERTENKIDFELSEAVQRTRTEHQTQLNGEIAALKGDADHVGNEVKRLKAEFEKLLNLQVAELTHHAQCRSEDLEQQLAAGAEDAALFDEWIEPNERCASLLAAARNAFAKILRELDEYRHGLGERLRDAADKVIEGDYEETDASVNKVEVPAVEAPPLGIGEAAPAV